MSKLPCGWAETSFGALNQFVSASINPLDFPEEIFELYSVPIFPTRKAEIVKGKDIGSTKQIVKPGDVLVCKINPRINRVWIVTAATGRRQIASSEWIVMRSAISDPRYLRSYFSSLLFRKLLCTDLTGVGGSLTRAQPKRVSTYGITLAPLAEQKRIADKLDASLARVEAARSRLERVPGMLKLFKESVLIAAMQGRLTKGGCETAAEWTRTSLAEVCESGRVITYGVIKLGEDVEQGVPCLRTSNVRWLSIESDVVKKIAGELSDAYSRTILRGGEVLVNVRGTLGGVVTVSDAMIGWNVSREIAVVPVDKTIVDSKFLALLIASAPSQAWLTSVERGVAYTGINLEDLRTLPVRLPPVDEQKEIVKCVDSLFAIADKIQAQYVRAIERIENLSPAILAKAFRGELVLQDPNDEPVEQLIERLKSLSTSLGTKGKRSKQSSTTAAEIW